MNNPFDDLRDAIQQADEVNRAVQHYSNRMMQLLEPNLRSADAYWLRKMKRALRDFDMTTGRWK